MSLDSRIQTGNWDLRPHRKRIINVTDETLRIWHAVMEDDSVPVRQTRMVYTVNSGCCGCTGNPVPSTTRRLAWLCSSRDGWDESMDRKKGYFESRWGVPRVVERRDPPGPAPLRRDSDVQVAKSDDEEQHRTGRRPISRALPVDAIPATAYKPAGSRARYDADYTHWGSGPARAITELHGERWRQTLDERTLIPAIIPPGAAHVHRGFFRRATSRQTRISMRACRDSWHH